LHWGATLYYSLSQSDYLTTILFCGIETLFKFKQRVPSGLAMKKILSFEYRITILYITIGALWILFSDELMVSLTSDPQQIRLLSTYKGWFYVLITGLLFFSLIRKETKRRNAIQLQLVEANRKAIEADRLKTAFLSNLSHYIRSPMNSILGFVELLKINDETDENRELFYSYINERSHHLLQTLSSIIEVSKLQQGQVEVSFKRFSLNKLIGSIIENARLDIDRLEKSIVVSCSCGLADGKDIICSDQEKVRQIVALLIDNAINFTPSGEVMIGYRLEESMVEIQVKDSGKGISTQKQQYLFNEFMANTAVMFNESEGAGLGLYLATGFAKLINGHVWLEHTDERGSIFGFRFPCVDEVH